MFEESITNWLNIILAIAVVWFGWMAAEKLIGKLKTVTWYVVFAAGILGVAEFIDLLQLFPDGTFMSDLIYEKEIPVLVFLLLAVLGLKGKK